MPFIRTPRGITPPAPGLDREEPTFVPEQDIPPAEGRGNARGERSGGREERAPRTPERE
jgi:hypothetical protein